MSSKLYTQTIRGIGPVEVRDAKRDLTITVKDHDVANAKKKTNNSCAMANAICRQEKGDIIEARVHKSVTLVKHRNGKWERYKTPLQLYLNLHMFDHTGKFAVGEYTLYKPTGSFTLEHINKASSGRRKPRGRTGAPTRHYHLIDGMRPEASKTRADIS